MKNIPLALGAISVLLLVCVVVGRVIGDPHIFMGARLSNLTALSSNFALLGILASLLFKDK